MLSIDTERQVACLLYEISQSERVVELSRQSLCFCPDFNPSVAFESLSVNSISAENLKDFLSKHEISCSEEELHCLVAQYDGSSMKSLNLYDFYHLVLPSKDLKLKEEAKTRESSELPHYVELMLAHHVQLEARQQLKLQILKKRLAKQDDFSCSAIFNKIDLQQIGAADEVQIALFMQNNGYILEQRDIDAIIRRIDSDNDRCLSLEEFSQAILHHPYIYPSLVAPKSSIWPDSTRELEIYSRPGSLIKPEEFIDHELDSKLEIPVRPDSPVYDDYQLRSEKYMEYGSPRRSRSPIQYENYRSESPIQYENYRSESPIRYENYRSESPIQYENSRLESPIQYENHRSESPLQYENYRSESPIQYENYRSECPLQYENYRSESPIQYENRRSESPIQYEDYRSESPIQYKNYRSESPLQYENYRPGSPVQYGHAHRKSSPESPMRPDTPFRPDIRSRHIKLIKSEVPQSPRRPGRPERINNHQKQFGRRNASIPYRSMEEISPLRTRLFSLPDLSEFVKFLKAQIKIERELEASKTELAKDANFAIDKLFRLIDIKDKEEINSRDFEHFLKDLSVAHSPDDVYLILRHYARDSISSLSLRDIENMWLPKDPSHKSELKNRMTTLHTPQNRVSLFSEDTLQGVISMLRVNIDLERQAENLRSSFKIKNSLEIFRHIDQDNDGFLSHEDWKMFLHENEVTTSDLDIEGLVDRYDREGKGKVSYSEFVQEMTPKI